jgi:hypothetical protein
MGVEMEAGGCGRLCEEGGGVCSYGFGLCGVAETGRDTERSHSSSRPLSSYRYDHLVAAIRQTGAVTIGEDLLEERRRRRRAGDPRLSPEGRELLRRVTRGDLADQFQAALDADLAADPLLGDDQLAGD